MYIYDPLKKEEKTYYLKQGHVTTNAFNSWVGGKRKLLI